MARRTSTATATQATKTTEGVKLDMGEFAVTPFKERRYIAVYFGVKEMYGQVVKKSNDNLDWEEFNTKFEECFGKVEERKHSLKDFEQFANTYFNKTLEQVVEYNQNSLRRRKKSTNVELPKPKLKAEVEAEAPAEEEIPY